MSRRPTEEKRRAAIYTVTLGAALAVGILIGAKTCTPEPEVQVEKKIVERTVPEPIPDGCACDPPPDAGAPETGVAAAPRSPEEKSRDDLPEAPGPADPATRRKLLAWVRDRSTALQPCRPKSLTETRYAVTFELDDEGAIDRVRINAPEKDVSRDVLECLERRMSDWEPPQELVEGRRELVFGLKL